MRPGRTRERHARGWTRTWWERETAGEWERGRDGFLWWNPGSKGGQRFAALEGKPADGIRPWTALGDAIALLFWNSMAFRRRVSARPRTQRILPPHLPRRHQDPWGSERALAASHWAHAVIRPVHELMRCTWRVHYKRGGLASSQSTDQRE